MKFFVTVLLVLLCLLIVTPPPTDAGGCYPVRYSYGYTPVYQSYSYPVYQQQSYYYLPQHYYNGQFYYHNAGTYNGTYYPAGMYAWRNGSWYAQSSYDNGYQNNIQYSQDWRSQLLELAAYRDKIEGQLRKQSLDQQAFAESIRSLGFQGNFQWQQYGMHPGYPYHPPYFNGAVNLGNYGASANTLYGYSYNTIKDVYGDSNLNALFQQSSRLAENAQTLGGQATQGFQETIAKEGDNRARIAEILAQAQAAKVALDAAKPQASSHVEEKSSLTVQQQQQQQEQGSGQGGGPVAGAAGMNPNWVTLAGNKCASCHSAKAQGGVRGGFDIAQYPQMSPDKKLKVWARLTTSDPAKRMPLAADGKSPGVPLTADEIKLFVAN